MLSDHQLARLVQDFYSSVLERENAARLAGSFLSEKGRQARSAYWGKVRDRARRSLGANRLADGVWVTQAAVKAQGLEWSTLSEAERNQCAQAIHRAGIDLAGGLKARYDGDFNFEPNDKLLRRPLASMVEKPSTQIEPSGAPSVPSEQSAIPGDEHVALPFSVKSLPKLTPFRVECWPLPVEAGCDMPRAPIGALGMSRRGAWDDGVEISFGS